MNNCDFINDDVNDNKLNDFCLESSDNINDNVVNVSNTVDNVYYKAYCYFWYACEKTFASICICVTLVCILWYWKYAYNCDAYYHFCNMEINDMYIVRIYTCKLVGNRFMI